MYNPDGGKMKKDLCTAGMLYDGMCGQNGDNYVGNAFPFDFHDYEEIIENCMNCWHDDMDGGSAEYANPLYICTEHDGYGNLVSFPFKKQMDCFEGRHPSTY